MASELTKQLCHSTKTKKKQGRSHLRTDKYDLAALTSEKGKQNKLSETTKDSFGISKALFRRFDGQGERFESQV